MELLNLNCPIIAVANQKGGVGKTTTTVNLPAAVQRLSYFTSKKILISDFDPSGNTSSVFGFKSNMKDPSISNLIRDRDLNTLDAIYEFPSVDIIPSSTLLADVQIELAGITNGQLRLAQRLRNLKEKYSAIIIDAPPSLGTLMNSVLNAADYLLIPVNSEVFSLRGIQALLGNIEEIRPTNPNLVILGFFLTFSDETNIAKEIHKNLKSNFGDQVFNTTIRRNVKLREAVALGKSIFEHAPTCSGAVDYLNLAEETHQRIARVIVHPQRPHPLRG